MTISSGEKYLVDTNVLLYSANQAAPLHERAAHIIQEGLEGKTNLVLAHQNLLEYAAVLTRGYKMPRESVFQDIQKFASVFEVIHPLSSTLSVFFDLTSRRKSGAYVFDMYLAATMLDNGVSAIITENAKDFEGLGLGEILTLASYSGL